MCNPTLGTIEVAVSDLNGLCSNIDYMLIQSTLRVFLVLSCTQTERKLPDVSFVHVNFDDLLAGFY